MCWAGKGSPIFIKYTNTICRSTVIRYSWENDGYICTFNKKIIRVQGEKCYST